MKTKTMYLNDVNKIYDPNSEIPISNSVNITMTSSNKLGTASKLEFEFEVKPQLNWY